MIIDMNYLKGYKGDNISYFKAMDALIKGMLLIRPNK